MAMITTIDPIWRELSFDVTLQRVQRKGFAPNGNMPQMPGEIAVGAPDTRCQCHVCQLHDIQQAEYTRGLRDVPGDTDESIPSENPGPQPVEDNWEPIQSYLDRTTRL